MSVLAEISVIDCDSCKTVIVIKDEPERMVFDAAWYDGLKVQFCPGCRVKPELQEQILEDIRLEQKIVDRVAAVGREYAN